MDDINNILKDYLPNILFFYDNGYKDKFYQKIQTKLSNPNINVTDYKDEIDTYIINYKQQLFKKGKDKENLEKLVKSNQTYEQFLEEVEINYPDNDFSDKITKEVYKKVSKKFAVKKKLIKFIAPKPQYYIDGNIKTNIGGDFFYFDLPTNNTNQLKKPKYDDSSDSESDDESDEIKISKKDKKILGKLENVPTGYDFDGINADLGGELLTKDITFKPEILLKKNTLYKYLYLDGYDLKMKNIIIEYINKHYSFTKSTMVDYKLVRPDGTKISIQEVFHDIKLFFWVSFENITNIVEDWSYDEDVKLNNKIVDNMYDNYIG